MDEMLVMKLVSACLVGFLGGTHCMAMCGGLLSALYAGQSHSMSISKQWQLSLSFNLARIISYAFAGLIAGAVSVFLSSYLILASGINLLQCISAILFILLGCYLLGKPWLLNKLEKLGGKLWQFLKPLSSRLFPINNNPRAFALGLLWGWLPCGMVYTALMLAMSSGNALHGFLFMLSFGLGTFPLMLTLGVISQKLNKLKQMYVIRLLSAVFMLVLGSVLLYQALSNHHA